MRALRRRIGHPACCLQKWRAAGNSAFERGFEEDDAPLRIPKITVSSEAREASAQERVQHDARLRFKGVSPTPRAVAISSPKDAPEGALTGRSITAPEQGQANLLTHGSADTATVTVSSDLAEARLASLYHQEEAVPALQHLRRDDRRMSHVECRAAGFCLCRFQFVLLLQKNNYPSLMKLCALVLGVERIIAHFRDRRFVSVDSRSIPERGRLR